MGQEDPDLAASYMSLGLNYCDTNYELAVEYSEKALHSLKRSHGSDHPYVAHVNCNLGWIHHRNGGYELGVHHYKRALASYRKTVGDKHPETMMTCNNFGVLYSDVVIIGRRLSFWREH